MKHFRGWKQCCMPWTRSTPTQKSSQTSPSEPSFLTHAGEKNDHDDAEIPSNLDDASLLQTFVNYSGREATLDRIRMINHRKVNKLGTS